jgi:hypothetical protein
MYGRGTRPSKRVLPGSRSWDRWRWHSGSTTRRPTSLGRQDNSLFAWQICKSTSLSLPHSFCTNYSLRSAEPQVMSAAGEVAMRSVEWRFHLPEVWHRERTDELRILWKGIQWMGTLIKSIKRSQEFSRTTRQWIAKFDVVKLRSCSGRNCSLLPYTLQVPMSILVIWTLKIFISYYSKSSGGQWLPLLGTSRLLLKMWGVHYTARQSSLCLLRRSPHTGRTQWIGAEYRTCRVLLFVRPGWFGEHAPRP